MVSQTTLNLHNKISNKVLNLDFVKRESTNYKLIYDYINTKYFKEKIEKLINSNDYSCKAILELCKDLISKLNTDISNKNLLFDIYQFSLFKSFPQAVNIEINRNLDDISIIYLEILKIFSQYERNKKRTNVNSKYPLEFLNNEEIKKLNNPDEYKRFINIFSDKYIYEMMLLNQEITGHNTLDHVSGVHYLALHIARQLNNIGLPVDLGRVSGAAAGHDIGKFGCVGEETKRVAYFHYYYTDLWFKLNNIPYIGHIAVNHSTWDLELENLPLESLILIYADFRVKNINNNENKREMSIFSLDDSFDIILNKLDNVDEAKEKRYKRVYAKLKDFENYMIDIGISVKLNASTSIYTSKKHYSLMENNEIVQNLKYLAINHNIHLLNKLKNESSLNDILNKARSERDWKKLRAYIQVFEEYSTYLTQNQKLITIDFLYDLLTHKEEDIRKQCASLIGRLISMFDEEYRKEIPKTVKIEVPYIKSKDLLDKYLKLFLYPDHKIIELHKEWITFSMRIMLASLFSHSSEAQKENYVKVLFKYYKNIENSDYTTQFYLLQTIKYIPMKDLNDDSLIKMFDFIISMTNNKDNTLRISSLERIYNLLYRIDNDSGFSKKLKEALKNNTSYSDIPAENFIKYKIAKKLQLEDEALQKYYENFINDNRKTSDVFLKNLKSATSWIIKKINVELLLEQVIEDPNKALHTALHLCNLIKVSAIENVRHHAGEALVKITPFLSLDQRNDVTVELLRALEIQGYQFTKYIPNYLGQIMLYLHPIELDELIDDFIDKIKNSSTQVTFLLFRTIGIAIQNYPNYKHIFKESEKKFNDILLKMIGILLNGLVSYNMDIKQVAFTVIGKELFSSNALNLEEKKDIFVLIAKKILTLLPEKEESELFFLTSSASLNHIYRFISDYIFFKGTINLNNNNKIAFFPGTFDPFSISHKEIAKAIRDLGFDVYLAVDEFSWSKNTQPHIFRKNIVNMSIASELDIYVFPDDFPVNISNSDDLLKLNQIFNNRNPYIVVGSDVILNASSYKKDCKNYCIHNFNHIIFERENLLASHEDNLVLEEGISKIKGNVITLTLPSEFKHISSTQIRDYIDENRDISQLIDPVAQKYIYEYGLYRREPQFKTILETKALDVEIINDISDELLYKICNECFSQCNKSFETLKKLKLKNNFRLILIKDTLNEDKILGFSVFHWVRSSNLYSEFNSDKISEYIRENSIGRIIVINGIFTDNSVNIPNLEQIILTETLSFCLSKDYNYAVYNNILKEYKSPNLYEILKLQGFVKIPNNNNNNPILTVNMNNPCTLNLDVESLIKEPFRSNPRVIKAVLRSRKRLQRALTKLYPGELILSFDRDMMYRNVIKKICNTNNVPTMPLEPRELGPLMCVPFGSILEGEVVPNTVTKSLHTEKMFNPDIKGFNIGAYPYYMNLKNQIKMLKSFNRSVILVDDLLNKGYRIRSIDPMLKSESLNVEKIIVGILSGRGKELMDKQKREVDSAYFIPNLKVWFNEDSLYPFIGGDTVWRGINPKTNILPSINLILPYTSPSFIMKSTKNDYVYNLSETAIMNSLDVLSTLENEYQNINNRSLTLRQLGEVLTSPRYPDRGNNVDYDLNLTPSQYLVNDLEHLKRIQNLMITLEE